ncbi:MAG: hypothetical protein WBA16_06920 [Nonlabens sp.]
MPTIVSKVLDIEKKIERLVEENNRLKLNIQTKEERIESIVTNNERLVDALSSAEERIVALRTANAMLGSNDYKTKTKLKINALVREIDQCIAQLT